MDKIERSPSSRTQLASIRRSALAAVGLAPLLALAACGSPDDVSAGSAEDSGGAAGLESEISLPPGGSLKGSPRGSAPQTFHLVIVASGASGSREVIGSVAVADGVFDGTGRVVEVAPLPGDPDSIRRADLVFAEGILHLVSEADGFSVSLNPKTCSFVATGHQTTQVAGGTGRFKKAAGQLDGLLKARGQAQRNTDRTCAQDREPRFEIDDLIASGSLTI